MYTLCPDCQTVHKLTLAQLRSDRGMMRCTHCSSLFDVLEFISESKPAVTGKQVEQKAPPERLPWEPEKKTGRAYWHVGLIIGLLLLTAQIVYFEGYAFSQNPDVRPDLEKFCRYLNCRLPVYKNLDEFSVLEGSFTLQPDHNYAFRAIIVNQASFSQAYPTIKLTLLDYNEKPFAQRVFKPQDYLPEAAGVTAMAPDAVTEIRLTIARPASKIGGYTFKLI